MIVFEVQFASLMRLPKATMVASNSAGLCNPIYRYGSGADNNSDEQSEAKHETFSASFPKNGIASVSLA